MHYWRIEPYSWIQKASKRRQGKDIHYFSWGCFCWFCFTTSGLKKPILMIYINVPFLVFIELIEKEEQNMRSRWVYSSCLALMWYWVWHRSSKMKNAKESVEKNMIDRNWRKIREVNRRWFDHNAVSAWNEVFKNNF